MAANKPLLVAFKKGAERAGIPYSTMRKLAFDGQLDVIRIGRAWYLVDSEIDRLIERLRVKVGQ